MAALAESAAASLPASLAAAPSHPAASSSLLTSNGAAASQPATASLPPRAPRPAAASLPARRRLRRPRPPRSIPVGATDEEASAQTRALEEAVAVVVNRLEFLRDLVGLHLDDIERELNQIMQMIVPPPAIIPQGPLMITVKTADGKVVYVYHVAAGKWVRDGEDGDGVLGSWSDVVRELTALVAKYTAGGGN